MSPRIARTRANTTSGRPRLATATANDQAPKIQTHNSKEPSWLPQTAENLYICGRSEFELLATTLTEKSSCRKTIVRQANAIDRKTKTPAARLGAKFIAHRCPRHAPTMGTVPSSTDKHSAMMSAICPASGIIFHSPEYWLFQALQRLPAAYSSRRVLPELHWQLPRHYSRAFQSRQRLLPRQKGQARCRHRLR